MSRTLIAGFNAGEWSPWLDGRVDLERYSFSCRRLENFVPTSYGPAFSRPGFFYAGKAKEATKLCRLEHFEFSETTTAVLEFGDQYIRFWIDGALVDDPQNPGIPLELASPWSESELYELQKVGINDITYITHPKHEPRILTRLADDNWTLGTIDFDNDPRSYPPLRDQNIDPASTIALAVPSATAWGSGNTYNPGDIVMHNGDPYTCRVTHTSSTGTGPTDNEPGVSPNWDNYWNAAIEKGTSVNITATEDIFAPEHVGSYFELEHNDDQPYIEITKSSQTPDNITSVGLYVVDGWQVVTDGKWIGEIIVERSLEGTHWEQVYNLRSGQVAGAGETGLKNYQVGGHEDFLTQIRIRLVNGNPIDTNGMMIRIERLNPTWKGVLRIDSVTDSKTATGTVIFPILKTEATVFWSEGAWNNLRGFPRSVTFHEQRLMFGGNMAQPMTIWGSYIGDFHNFRRGTGDDNAIDFTLAATKANPIQWLSSEDVLLIGTRGEEWKMQGTSENAITPSAVRVSRQTGVGSAHLQADIAGETSLFVDHSQRSIYELAFEFESDKHQAPDLTKLARHITEGNILQVAVQHNPETTLWCLLGNGKLASLTYERRHSVVAWAIHNTQGTFESVAVIPGLAGQTDEIWVSVKREIQGSATRYIERMDPDHQNKLEASDIENVFCVDAGVMKTDATPFSILDGLDHLEGKRVSVLAGGRVESPKLVENGSIPLEREVTVASAGLGFTALCQPSRQEATIQDGTTRGRRWRVSQAIVSLWESREGEVISNPDQPVGQEWEKMRFDYSPDSDCNLFTGDFPIRIDSAHEDRVNFAIRQTNPLPMNLLALGYQLQVYGP